MLDESSTTTNMKFISTVLNSRLATVVFLSTKEVHFKPRNEIVPYMYTRRRLDLDSGVPIVTGLLVY